MFVLRKYLLTLVLLLSSCHAREPSAVSSAFNPDELAALEVFFQTLFEESQAGYVLYGKKPLCVETFIDREPGSALLARTAHRFSTDLKSGALVWQKLGLEKFCNQYILHIGETPSGGSRDLLLINKKEFLRTIKANLPLFQYVLGPSITPEKLLTQLTTSRQSFREVFAHDAALIGIALGYGTQNALHAKREEAISSGDKRPSFGFTTTQDELAWLSSKRTQSVDQSPKQKPLLPRFGCYDRAEQSTLVALYEKPHAKIATLLASKTLLKDVLSRLWERRVALPSQETVIACAFPPAIDLPGIIARSLWSYYSGETPEYQKLLQRGIEAGGIQGLESLPDDEFFALVAKRKADPEYTKEYPYQLGLRIGESLKRGKNFFTVSDVAHLLSEAVSGASPLEPFDAVADETLTRLNFILYRRPSQR